jgi:hypothetical protein
MKRWLSIGVLVLAALMLASTSFADPGDGKGKGKAKHGNAKFSFTFTNTDNGSCGAAWATLQETRTYSVKDRGDGTFTLTRRDKGTFTTIGGASPGSCDTTGKHGKTVRSGVKGKFGGYLVGTVKASSFNPNAPCAVAAECATREGFIHTYFSADATYSCDQNSTDCKFNYNYTAPAKAQNTPKLIYRHWQDKGKGAGTMLHEEFIGDIANA